ncbi:1,4-dihydroxy-2-naphthoate octaprenyltransferase [Flavobacterium columnare]|uniref:1,4-dihydroxy-2-naphthoate octaprenyltransferase n=1 Tax=Flavobacterium columnare TaxID=996 RepID=UPI0017832F44|nr:1,4-dihydroxy-2-naphthoate octaprenyltransferase [Flavobacterium columnare]QOG90747.1 1,4-dihydroxy-2-naphthoate octaprenyltransferase [Flavobacterium columnare]QOG93401.1 1,4-dihydroxy-2-naphthoate octaprenyltransferase [Flavobacterium columnare]QOG96068.1 1,4-dihydroxy-2-naphthoate octaprenyltransferase [Flavobacterium columnare]QOG98728.1 1,4-dihydroxy-2-naphthoate octaprenyltransferase [Flavobacterium columnare]QOH01387.1 1,4-dihydroxy-2-naphthoate octaprenyltransferase [Flavobacterium 
MKHWIQAARLRTLPLSLSGILVGSMYAYKTSQLTTIESFDWRIFVLAIFTTIGFQVLSNFANDYGDGVKGTDANRIGEKRLVASGEITPKQMKIAVYITAIISFLSACLLIYLSFKDMYLNYSLFFLVLGIVSIIAAIKYTVGNFAYGYRGLGDIFVFIFFGWVSTMGVNFLFTKDFNALLILPASAIGMLSAGVLNLNNMRDEVLDRRSGKNTLVVRIGGNNAKKYHYFLIITAMILILLFGYLSNFTWEQYFFLVGYFPLISHLMTVRNCSDNRSLDPELKKLAISTFLISLILSLTLIFNQ